MKKLLLSLCLLTALPAFSAETLRIATGKESGTYSSFFKSIQLVCESDDLKLVEVGSTGSDANIDAMINKEADGAFLQSDTLQFTAMNDPRASESQIRVLLPMYPEEVHVIALRTLTKTTGGITFLGKTYNGTVTVLNSLADLENVTVGAWGGSYTTARAISYLGSVKYSPVPFDDDKKALAALDAGQIAAIIAVGGQPLGFAKGLSAKYKLLTIDAALADKVKAYQKAMLSYRNLQATGVQTVAARSVLAVKNYASPTRRAALSALKQCIMQHEADFKETTGHHPKWADVDFTQPVSWAMYETVKVRTAPPAAPVPAKK